MPEQTRPAAVAGMFYPDNPQTLCSFVKTFLAENQADVSNPSRIIIAPHAGYVYSGPIAASAFNAAGPLVGTIRRAIVYGPSHHVDFDGLCAPESAYFSIPGASFPIDDETISRMVSAGLVVRHDAPHRQEHSIEVELPFIHHLFGAIPIVPLLFGRVTDRDSLVALEAAGFHRADTLVVISSDLSHFLPYEKAREKDRFTSDCITHLDPFPITGEHACGSKAIRGALLAAKESGLNATLLDLRNSGDTAGDKDRVVGYGAYAFRN